MSGYIYTMFQGADPGAGWKMTDPLITAIPTFGACMPNIRRVVKPGDFIFSVTGRVPKHRPYVVGGFSVKEKISSLEAFERFPQNRMRKTAEGELRGNIIVDAHGRRLPFDYHTNFEKRIDNYIVGGDPIALASPSEIQRGRDQTIQFLSELFGKPGTSLIDVMGRWHKLNDAQVMEVVKWLKRLQDKGGAA